MERLSVDVCVVGAGIVGLAHAHEARARGLSVAVLERGSVAAGASVRNFGHVIVSGMDGEALECARRARERWLALGAAAGLEVRPAGTLIVARADDELAALQEIAADPVRGARVLTPAQAGELAPIPVGDLAGALHATLDLRVDPRRAVAALAAALADDAGAHVRWRAAVHAVEPGRVAHRHGEVRAERVIVCPGPELAELPPALAVTREGLTRCKLQMLRVAAPGGRTYAPALLTALSLARYPGYAAAPSAAAVAARLARERPELTAAGVHLIVTQLPGGDLVLGDTHEYGDTVSPFGSDALDELVLGEARRLLGVDAPGTLDVRERWHGVYPTAPGDPFSVTTPLPGVAVAAVVAGIGMTTALGLPPRTFAALDAGAPATAAAAPAPA